ncbi:Shikimate kinase [Candidatus Magnetaquicoccaceae bacterium FCR-1]|uniref:Shikimate kinase n=1 Tax=Candidatus Magnetaquiglobus chichijimensis TaxID=3141448 RepID=A0ABQ0C4I0_9PROT
MNIVLIGPRGVGKSGASRILARLTRFPVLSTDLLLSYEHDGLPIPAILRAIDGDWSRFRDLEYAVVAKVARLDGVIIDTGGGVVVDLDDAGGEIYSERKLSLLKRNGFIVHLTGDPARLAARVARDPNRPALSAAHSEEAIMRRREPLYRRAADLTVDGARMRREELAEWIFKRLPGAASGLH